MLAATPLDGNFTSPMACINWFAMHDDHDTWRTDVAAWWLGICRALLTSPELPSTWQTYCVSGKPRNSIAEFCRRAGTIQSIAPSAEAEPSTAASSPVQAP